MIERRSTSRQDYLNRTGSIIGFILVSILAFVAVALVFIPIPDANMNALNLLMGNLIGLVGIVVAFFFGSSSEAKKQTETIDTLAKTAQVAQNTASSPTELGTVSLPGNKQGE